jgi:transaldolase
MKPANLKTKIFLDSGDPAETKLALDALGFLDGQTTNPSLVAKNPNVTGKKFSAEDIYNFYHKIVSEISGVIPSGSVSIEVYSDANTTTEAMMKQAREFFKWIPNAHIKFPTTAAGLAAAETAIAEGMRVNMTLVFSQEQAAAVYSATKGAKKGDVFVSPFVGRLDDRGEYGMGLIKNILEMYRKGDGHVEVLTASVRSPEHFISALSMGSDIITAPLKIITQWQELGFPTASAPIQTKLTPIPYQEIDLQKSWDKYNIHHELTDAGIKKFADDWDVLIK